ncbi:MAG: bifunctional (p)ppGpp synthetase/guanosine-3',5'-bis(diphosphate) 3'-pyrophosphohydrolase, partial [Moraxellaceae bacterium]
MVTVREELPRRLDDADATQSNELSFGEIDLEIWLERLCTQLDVTALNQLSSACHLVIERTLAQKRADRSGAFSTGVGMTDILGHLKVDEATLVAAMLYRSVRERLINLDEILSLFGDHVALLVKGTLAMGRLSDLIENNKRLEDHFANNQREHLTGIYKMLISVTEDVRVVLIKLAERTFAVRELSSAPRERQERVGREILSIYAPLAHRLGIAQLKWELEDLAFRYLSPERYKEIATLLNEKRLEREHYIQTVINNLKTELSAQGISAEVTGRAKHIYSIWRKMKRKGIPFSQVYDIRAVRILVPSVRDCYTVLGIVHSLWRNIPHEFDDYIASPKENGYRSLHTAVMGPENKVLEIQIRTFEMHEESELGVCAHWRYKGTDTDAAQDSYEQKISWLRQVLEWHEELGGDSQQLQDDLRAVDQDRIYVFTPDGHVVDLPRTATPLDFAYRIHTDVGHRCRGAKVNNRIVPLNYHLNNADQVEILTGKREAPSRDWLTPALGYVNTARARAKVQHWFKQQARDQNIGEGQALLDREFKRLALLDLDFESLAKKLRFNSLDDLYAAVGASDIGVGQVLNAAQKQLDDA